MSVRLKATPRPLLGTELETPTLRRWRKATQWVLVGGVVVLANPIIFAIAKSLRSQNTLLRHDEVLYAAPIITAFWASRVVRRAQRSQTSTRMIGWAVVGAAFNCGSIGAVLAYTDGTNAIGAVVAGLLGVFVGLPVSAPVGVAVGLLLWALHHWERELRRAPTHDARVRWLSVTALWLVVVGVAGELLGYCAAGFAWRSDAVAMFLWGPHLALGLGIVLALVGAWRAGRLCEFLAEVDAGRVRGLKVGSAEGFSDALTAGKPDGVLMQTEGAGAFRTARLGLGTISRAGAARRHWALVALAVVGCIIVTVVFSFPVDDIPYYAPPAEFW